MDANSVAKIIEVTGESTLSFEDAIQSIIKRTRTLHAVKSLWVKDQNVYMENGEISRYHVTAKVTFVLEE